MILTTTMGDTEGSQRFIYPTVINSTRPSFSALPQDYFRLRINSNDTHSKFAHPNNNCFNFVIDFPPSTAESIQYRIAQCNRYQVIDLKVPVRNSKGIQVGKYYLLYNSYVKRPIALTTTPTFFTNLSGAPCITEPNQFATNQTSSATISAQDFACQYEALEELHLHIECNSFNEVFFQDSYQNKSSRKYPQNQKYVQVDTGKEILHLLDNHQASLMYDNEFHQQSPFYAKQNYLIYPQFSGHGFESTNPFLISSPRVIHPTFPPNLSSMHMRIFPNASMQTYDLHAIDTPNGLEMDITLIFYNEHDLFEH